MRISTCPGAGRGSGRVWNSQSLLNSVRTAARMDLLVVVSAGGSVRDEPTPVSRPPWLLQPVDERPNCGHLSRPQRERLLADLPAHLAVLRVPDPAQLLDRNGALEVLSESGKDLSRPVTHLPLAAA